MVPVGRRHNKFSGLYPQVEITGTCIDHHWPASWFWLANHTLVWNADNVGGKEGPVTSELIIKDIDGVCTSIIKIIQHRGTVVRELDNRVGRRKDAVRSRLTDQLTPEALQGLEEQLAASAGMPGPADSGAKLTHAIT